MTLQNKIFIRKESIRRMLWEKVQEWQWHKIENAASRAFSFYDFKNNIDAALDEMTEVEMQSILQHERGEIESAKLLGEEWKVFLSNITSIRLDMLLRAAKDFYADTITTLPILISDNNQASMHFYAANMSPLRKKMSPTFMTAYQGWCETNDLSLLGDWVNSSRSHWQNVCNNALMMYLDNESEIVIEQFIENNPLDKK